MREAVLAGFFMGRLTAKELADDLRGSQRSVSATHAAVEIEDMTTPFLVTRGMAIALCDAVLIRELPPEDLQTIGFALLASQYFYWKEEDDEPAETFYDWSAPEINLPLTYENIRIFRDRLFPNPC